MDGWNEKSSYISIKTSLSRWSFIKYNLNWKYCLLKTIFYSTKNRFQWTEWKTVKMLNVNWRSGILFEYYGVLFSSSWWMIRNPEYRDFILVDSTVFFYLIESTLAFRDQFCLIDNLPSWTAASLNDHFQDSVKISCDYWNFRWKSVFQCDFCSTDKFLDPFSFRFILQTILKCWNLHVSYLLMIQDYMGTPPTPCS